MDIHSFFEDTKLKHLPKKHLSKLHALAKEYYPDATISNEHTLLNFYQELRTTAKKSKREKQKLKEAEQLVLNIAGVMHGNVVPASSPKGRERTIARAWHKLAGQPAVEGTPRVLSARQAQQILLEGNEDFKLKLTNYQSHNAPLERPTQYDIVILACSDARNVFSLFSDFRDKNILVVHVAGNSYSKHPKEHAKIDAALMMLKKGGTLVVAGHEKCGAVDACIKHYSPESKSLVSVIDSVDIRPTVPRITNPYQCNIVNQAARLAKHSTVIVNGIKVVPVSLDFTRGEHCFQHLGEGKEPELVIDLRASVFSHIEAARLAGKDLSKQEVHTIVVCDPTDLGRFTDPRVIFNAGMNDIFVASFNGSTLDPTAIGSIEYALEHVENVRFSGHVLFLHSDPRVIEKVSAQLLADSKIAAQKTNNGKTITRSHFTELDGSIRFY